MQGLNLNNLMGCLMCFVVMGSGEYIELYYWRGLEDLLLVNEVCWIELWGLQISISSWMYSLPVYFKCVLILTLVSCSVKILLERGNTLSTGSFCGSLRGPWRITGSSGSDNRECLSSYVYKLPWKEMRVNDSALFVWVFVGVVGGSWYVVGGDWCGGCWLAILKKIVKISYLPRSFVFIVIFFHGKDLKYRC